MFFKNLFSKNSSHYLDKGIKYLADERYADARQEFLEALSRVDDTETDARLVIQQKLQITGNKLGAMNLEEAEQFSRRGNTGKALEHLNLLLELADDSGLREQAYSLIKSMETPVMEDRAAESSSHCGTCTTASAPVAQDGIGADDHLSDRERFELSIQTLPGDLATRYAALGDIFMSAYLMSHGGREKPGRAILQDMLKDQENDIIFYELALLSYRAGDASGCEELLRKALSVNSSNPLCYLSLVQLLADSGGFDQAVPLLHHMIENNILVEQALIFLGDINQQMGNEDVAIAEFSKALSYPGAAKASAERLVPLLSKQGRMEDAAFIVKKYLKGCC